MWLGVQIWHAFMTNRAHRMDKGFVVKCIVEVKFASAHLQGAHDVAGLIVLAGDEQLGDERLFALLRLLTLAARDLQERPASQN